MLLEILEQEYKDYSNRHKIFFYSYRVLLDKHLITGLGTNFELLPEQTKAFGICNFARFKIPYHYFEQSNYTSKVINLLSYYFANEDRVLRECEIYNTKPDEKVVFSLEIPSLIEKQARINAKKQIIEQDFI